MSTEPASDLPLITRAEHRDRIARGGMAPGPYAFVFPRATTIREHLTHSYHVKDESDRSVTWGAASGPTMARDKAKRAGATFIVDWI